ncbi:MAG: hypothetical protein DI535_16615 [Citrobacter freundii]|nr:MAG: hypothetical protein DI535_16615 [Citrobacter freundii]
MHICFNGKTFQATDRIFTAANKGYRYGDGLFETIKIVNRNIPLFELHMERLFDGVKTLELSTSRLFTAEKLRSDIIALCNKNQCSALGRIRLSVSRGEGGIYEQEGDHLHYLIEAWPANAATNRLNENGLVIGVYPHAKKSMDIFSSLKSANYLPYTMAARFTKQQQWNDCLVLNTEGNIADATIANVFLVKNDTILTPAQGEGGVKGVMKTWLLEKLRQADYKISEKKISVDEALEADEIFLTNAMNGIRWVGQMENKSFTNRITLSIYREFIQQLWS